MNEIVIPLVSPLSRKYYAYASEKSEHKHTSGRRCLEFALNIFVII